MKKSGRKSKIKDVKKKVRDLRELNYSFGEIAETLGMNSRQLARYHYVMSEDKLLTVDKEKVKE